MFWRFILGKTDCGGVTAEQMISFLNNFSKIKILQQGEMPQNITLLAKRGSC